MQLFGPWGVRSFWIAEFDLEVLAAEIPIEQISSGEAVFCTLCYRLCFQRGAEYFSQLLPFGQ
jgi:hypothetical protein